jgi:hypothetical protein
VFPRKNKKKPRVHRTSFLITFQLNTTSFFFVLFPVNSLRETKSYLNCGKCFISRKKQDKFLCFAKTLTTVSLDMKYHFMEVRFRLVCLSRQPTHNDGLHAPPPNSFSPTSREYSLPQPVGALLHPKEMEKESK